MSREDPDHDPMRRVRRIVRHDLRNPLAIIIGRCDLLDSEVLGPLVPAQRDSVATITRHAERLAAELDELAGLLDAVTEER